MKILLFHPVKSTNTGDHIILQGTERILKEAFGDVEFIYQEFESSSWKLEKYDVDLLVVSGTPWFWQQCCASVKYKQLEYVVELYKDVKKVGLGLGSCYTLTTNILPQFIYPSKTSDVDWRKDDYRGIQKSFGKFDLLLTRDLVAQKLLETAGIESYETICPAVFAYEGHITAPDLWKPLLIFQNPEVSVSRESCDEDFTKQYVDFQFKLAEKYNMEVRTASPVDSDYLRDVKKFKCERENEGGKPYSTWIKNSIELFEVLIRHNPVVSCRVHEAIPSRTLGNLTFILPMDTRFLTATKIGVIPLWTYGYPLDLLEIQNLDVEEINALTQTKVKEGRLFVVEKLRRLK